MSKANGERVGSLQETKERAKKWQLTENNPTYTKQEAVKRLCEVGTTLYAVGASEIGESGTKHIHVFVVYKNAISMTTLKKAFPRAHLEQCRGSYASNRDYIVKSDKEPYEVGELPLTENAERKADVSAEVVAHIFDGETPLQILRTCPHLCDYVVRNFKSLCVIYEEACKTHSFKR